MADSGYKSISRIDATTSKTHGWYVRVYYKGEMHSKFFSDSRFENKQVALEEAVKYRDELEKRLGKPRTDRPVVRVSPKSETGVVGVRRRRKAPGKKGKNYYEVYEVTWSPEPGKMKRTSVSIAKYGEEEAFKRACAIRKQKEKEMYSYSESKNSGNKQES